MNSPPGWNWNAIISGMALLCTLFTAAIVFGEQRGQVNRNTEDIRDMRAENRAMGEKLSDIQGDVKAIRTSLSWIIPEEALKEQKQ